jgi:hypothetical protein
MSDIIKSLTCIIIYIIVPFDSYSRNDLSTLKHFKVSNVSDLRQHC